MASRDKKPSKPSSSRAGGIRTLSDLNRRSGPDSDSDDDAPQEYYTGGEKSGMLVQDPTKGNGNGNGNDVDAIFNIARQLGAVEGPVDNLRPSSSSRSFTGPGRLLSGETVPSAPQQPEAVVHNIVFWANGFTVNDGPLRRLDDPENASFLESIRKSECPKELEPEDRSSPVHVNLIRRDEPCPEPEKQRQVAFQGVGRTLGSSSVPAATEPAADSVPPLNASPAPSMGLIVDETLPSTSIQLRLADGTRMIAHFNYQHTVNDIRSFINASRPGGAQNYQLQLMGFPPKLLTDATQTIEQAGLGNSVVIQKF
ncbi:plant UBX domain containing protein 4 [Euphorbia peplus]|nr:plant UBX domain containing protein 4 [Euphorbia peplus]